jgi:hypothetical protein
MSIVDDSEKPEDYIFSSVPKSSKQAASQVAEARVTSTVKSAMQDYLDKYFSPTGCYREQLKLTAPYSIQYETGITGSLDPADPTVYNLQLARLWGQLRAKLPCIIIVDSKIEYEPSGLGGILGSGYISPFTSTVFTQILANVSLSLEIAANDETTCGDLRDLLLYILGPLTIFNKSHILHSNRPQDKWEVRLPAMFTPQGLSRKFYTSDAKDAFWTSGVDLEVAFESRIQHAFSQQTQLMKVSDYLEGSTPDGIHHVDGSMGFKPDPQFEVTSIIVPDVVRLGKPTPIGLSWIPAEAKLVSDDPRVAIVTIDNIIIPKRIGNFNVLLLERGKVKEKWAVKCSAN